MPEIRTATTLRHKAKDKVLRRAIAYRLVQTLGVHYRTGKIASPGKAKGGIKI